MWNCISDAAFSPQRNLWLGMYTEDRYFLVPAPNWVGTRVPLRFWTITTVISTLKIKKKIILFLNDFYSFLTWMVVDVDGFWTSTQT